MPPDVGAIPRRRLFLVKGDMSNQTIQTIEHEKRLFAKLSKGKSIAAACRYARISRSSYYKWRDDDKEFAQRADDALDDGTDLIEDVATDKALDGDNTMIALMLKARRPKVYGDKSSVALTGEDGGPIPITLVINRPPGEPK